MYYIKMNEDTLPLRAKKAKLYDSLEQASRELKEWHRATEKIATYNTQPYYRNGCLVSFVACDGYANLFRYSVEGVGR